LWAEIQLTGWLYDGGLLLCITYVAAIAAAVHLTYKMAIKSDTHLADLATMVLSVQILVVGLCFTGLVFNTQMGIVFWLLSASVYGAQRTAIMEELALEAEAAEADTEEDDGHSH
jgi:hypothetical protein